MKLSEEYKTNCLDKSIKRLINRTRLNNETMPGLVYVLKAPAIKEVIQERSGRDNMLSK